MVLRKSKKTNREFYGCSHYPQCNGVIWGDESKLKANPEMLILDELQSFRKEFNERFDGLAEFLAKLSAKLK